MTKIPPSPEQTHPRLWQCRLAWKVACGHVNRPDDVAQREFCYVGTYFTKKNF